MSQKPGLKPPSKLTRPPGTTLTSASIPSTTPAKQTNVPDLKDVDGAKMRLGTVGGATGTSAATGGVAKGTGLAAGVAEQYASQLLKKTSGAAADVSSTEDCFKVGDRVWVGGTKLGRVAFMGETTFAAGEWVGVVLDDATGKNDGSVGGARYFTCEPMKGVFAKAAKLTKLPETPEEPVSLPPSVDDSSASLPHAEESDSKSKVENGKTSGSVFSGQSRSSSQEEMSGVTPDRASGGDNSSSLKDLNVVASGSKTHPGPGSREASLKRDETLKSVPNVSTVNTGATATEKVSKSSAPTTKTVSRLPKSQQGSTTALNQLSLVGSSLSLVSADFDQPGPGGPPPAVRAIQHGLKAGDRILVGGNKAGTLRYIGTTDFAKGEWAGVELDEPNGKNDGTVEGKRYFQCVPMFGLFAPLSKVSRAPAALTSTPRRSPASVSKLPVGPLSRERSGSQESISSISSATSSASRTRVRLGVTSLANQTTPKMKSSSTPVAESALQKALKEKEEHIEQLLMERDLERSEVARTIAQVEEVESRISALTIEYERQAFDNDESNKILKTTIEKLETEKTELKLQLDEEKRKVEDLQFTIEEVSVDKGDLETQTASYSGKLKDLEVELKKQTEKVNELTEQLNLLQTEKEHLESLSVTRKESGEASQAKKESGEDVSQARREFEDKINEMKKEFEDRVLKVKTESEDGVSELKREMEVATTESKRLQMQTEEFQTKMTEAETKKEELENEVKRLKSEMTANNDRLTEFEIVTSSDVRTIQELKSQLQQQERQMSELTNNSGDSSEQLKFMNAQLIEKDRKVSELLLQLLASDEKLNQLNRNISIKTEELSLLQTDIAKLKDQSIAREKDFEEKERELMETGKLLKEVKENHESIEENMKVVTKHENERKQELEEVNSELLRVGDELAKVSAESETAKQSHLKDKENWEEDRERFAMLVEQTNLELESSRQDRLEENVEEGEGKKFAMLLEQSKTEMESLKINHLKEKESLKAEGKKFAMLLEESILEVEILRASHLKEKENYEEEKKKNFTLLEQSKAEQERLNHLVLKVESEKLKLEEDMMVRSSSTAKQEEGTNERRLETIKSVLESKVNELQDSISQLDQEKGRLKSELEKTTSDKVRLESELEKTTLDKNRNCEALLALEKDATSLKHRILQLESSGPTELNANEATVAASTSNLTSFETLKSDYESSQAQVEFLNSVIVDIQRKNESLKLQLEVATSNVVNANGVADISSDLDNSGSLSLASRVPPRLYCDICDAFDLHDTDDCPTQAMSVSPPPSRHHGNRDQERLYCDICEVFGHSTEQCDDEQTF